MCLRGSRQLRTISGELVGELPVAKSSGADRMIAWSPVGPLVSTQVNRSLPREGKDLP